MNDDNHLQKNSDRRSTNSVWSKIVDQLGQSSNEEGSAEFEPDAQVELTSELLDDLELDGQLRMLGQLSTPQDSFVRKVIAQTHPESSTVHQTRSRLPVIEPQSGSTSNSNSAPANRPRLPVVGPSFDNDTPDTTEEANFESSVNDGHAADNDNDLSSATFAKSNEGDPRPSFALLGSLAATLLIGCFLGAMWWFAATPEIADSTTTDVPSASVKSNDNLVVTPHQPNNSQQESLEILPEGEGNMNGISVDDALVEHSDDKTSGIESSTALTEGINGDGSRILESTPDANSNPTLADATQNADAVVGVTKDESIASGVDEGLKDQLADAANADGQDWDLKLDWNLAIQFQNNGVGSVTLNGEPVQAIILQDNARFLLHQIADELKRRVQFLENRLGTEISGGIQIGKTDFRFGKIYELDETLKGIDQQIASVRPHSLSINDLMKVRAVYREGIFANRDKFSSIDLANKKLRFYTEDEAFTICSVLSASETMLQDLAKKRLAWEEGQEFLVVGSELENRIEPEDFQQFAKSGILAMPDPTFSEQSIAGIQNLGSSELLRMLQHAPSIELFRDLEEFQQSKDFVYANGPADMKLRLSIDQVDRQLKKPIGHELRSSLLERKGYLTTQLRREIAKQKGGPGDAVAMEPLRDVLARRTDLQGLPLVMGQECQSDATETHDLKQVSSFLGRTIGRFNGSLGSRDVAQNDAFRNFSIKAMVAACLKDHADRPSSQKLKTIDQILQIDHPRLRLEMIEALRKSGSEAAVEVLVDKAKFDLEPEVRISATDALANVEPDKVRGQLLEGFKYPWHVVAEHSAEALVRLNDQEAVPELIDMLELPHPQTPFVDNGTLVQQELVGINHMRNCLLCHAPSINSEDSIRGLIPHQSEPLPPQYYDPRGEEAELPFTVRADITYLEQDFSAVQPVANPGPWPADQRFDYVVQRKRLTPVQAENVARQINQSPNRNRDAIIFALRELTGEAPADNSSSNWRNIVAGQQNDKK